MTSQIIVTTNYSKAHNKNRRHPVLMAFLREIDLWIPLTKRRNYPKYYTALGHQQLNINRCHVWKEIS